MIRPCRMVLLCSLALPAVLGVVGCREAEVPESYAYDLGDEDAVLLPTGSVFYKGDLGNDRAEWVDFRAVEDLEPVADVAAGAAVDGSGVEAEIRELLAGYNEVVADSEATVDDLLDYYVDGQRDAIRPALESMPRFAAVCGELRRELQTRKPDEAQRADEALKALEASVRRELVATSITVVSDEQVSVAFPVGSLASKLDVIVMDDEWYFEIVDADELAAVNAGSERIMTTFRGWLDDLKGGGSSPDDILQKLDTAAQAAAAQAAAGDEEVAGD